MDFITDFRAITPILQKKAYLITQYHIAMNLSLTSNVVWTILKVILKWHLIVTESFQELGWRPSNELRESIHNDIHISREKFLDSFFSEEIIKY